MQTRAPLSYYEYTEEGHTVVENALKRSHFTTIFKINNIHWINKISKSYKIDGIHMIRKIHKVRKTHKIRKIHKTFFLKMLFFLARKFKRFEVWSKKSHKCNQKQTFDIWKFRYLWNFCVKKKVNLILYLCVCRQK